MNQGVWKWSPRPHEVAVIKGIDAVDAYHDGETCLDRLNELGIVCFYSFNTTGEVNAFVKGVEEAQGGLDALPVDELTLQR